MSDGRIDGELSKLWRIGPARTEDFDFVFRGVDPLGTYWDRDAYYPDWVPSSGERPFDPIGAKYTFREKPKRKKIPTFPETIVPITCPKSIFEEFFSELLTNDVVVRPCTIDGNAYVQIVVTTVIDLIDMERSLFRRNSAHQIYRFNRIVLRRPSSVLPPIFLCGSENCLRNDPIVDHRFHDIVKVNRFTGLAFTEVDVL